jgi:hypothetical protein
VCSCDAACAELEAAHSRPVAPADAEAVQGIIQQRAAGSGVSTTSVAAQMVPSYLSPSEFAPVCAVTGGVIANNVVRAVSKSGAPLSNFFYYSLMDGKGVVEQVPPPAAAAAAGGAAAGQAPATIIEEAIEL